MRVTVTGGCGFIGSAVCTELRARGHQPVVFDRPRGDVRERISVSPVDPPDGVIHLAGVLGTHELFDTPHTAIDVNITGTVNVLDACRKAGARYVGITMPQVFPSVYTATKIAAVGFERAYHHTYGLPVSRVRAYNAFGAGQKHGPGHPQKIVPAFATEAWAGRPLPVWGDGSQTVDLIHTSDLARMLVDALDHGDDVTFDGGTGQAFTVNEVAEMVLQITGSKSTIEYLPMRRGEIPTHIVAEGEGWDRLGWVPRFDPALFEQAVVSYRRVAAAA
jgi:UDP-glucose 4-epimerase